MADNIDLDGFTQRALHEVGHADDQRSGVDVPRMKILLAGKRQQPMGQCRAAQGAVLRPVQQCGDIAPRGQTFLRHFDIADHDRQKIVEVVGAAAGKLADGIHLLSLAELFFPLAVFGDVIGHSPDRDHDPIFIDDREFYPRMW